MIWGRSGRKAVWAHEKRAVFHDSRSLRKVEAEETPKK